MGEWRQWAASLLFPGRCYICGAVVPWHRHLCASCVDDVPYILPPICPYCGRSKGDCVCRKHRRHYERCVSPLYYTERMKLAVRNLKTYGYRQTVDAFAAEMAELIRREYGGIPFDMLVPVPLYRSDYAARGFNQSALLAQALLTYVRAPYRPILSKLYPTAPQKSLTLERRTGNLLGVFDVDGSADVEGATILLVDDIVTTGSTLDECAKMLKLYGAKDVYAVTAAAALLKDAEGKHGDDEGECK